MKWLDRYIDYTHQRHVDRTVGIRLEIGPFSRIGSIFNVVVCGALGAFTLWMGITGQTPGYVVAIFAGVMEIIFVRVCVRTFRGDFADFVLDPPDIEGNDADRTL